MRIMGEVTFVHPSRGYGFLRSLPPTNQRPTEVFFHINEVQDRIVLQEGDLVAYEVGKSPKKPGKMEALRVKLTKRGAR